MHAGMQYRDAIEGYDREIRQRDKIEGYDREIRKKDR